MKKIMIFIFISVSVTTYAQQLLWQTANENGDKYIPLNQVKEEVMNYYDFYRCYFDLTGYNKKTFLKKFVKKGKNNYQKINTLTVYCEKYPNEEGGSYIQILCIDKERIDMICFSNNYRIGDLSCQPTSWERRKWFEEWFKTILNLNEEK